MSGGSDPFSTPEPFAENKFDWRAELRAWPRMQRSRKGGALHEACWHIDPDDVVLAAAPGETRRSLLDLFPFTVPPVPASVQSVEYWLLIATDRRLYRMRPSRHGGHILEWEDYHYEDIARWELFKGFPPWVTYIRWRTKASDERGIILSSTKLTYRLQDAVEPRLPAEALDV